MFGYLVYVFPFVKISWTIEISVVFLFFNNDIEFFLFNIYSNSNQLALKYLNNTEVDIWNVLIMTSDFND